MKITSNEKVSKETRTVEVEISERVFNLELSGKEFFVLTSLMGAVVNNGREHGFIVNKLFNQILKEQALGWASGLFAAEAKNQYGPERPLESYKSSWENLKKVKNETN